MTDIIAGIVNIPEKEGGVRNMPPNVIIKRFYSDYFRDFNKEKLLSTIQMVKNSGVNFKRDKDFLEKIINEARDT